jgi:hypothetical protein
MMITGFVVFLVGHFIVVVTMLYIKISLVSNKYRVSLDMVELSHIGMLHAYINDDSISVRVLCQASHFHFIISVLYPPYIVLSILIFFLNSFFFRMCFIL